MRPSNDVKRYLKFKSIGFPPLGGQAAVVPTFVRPKGAPAEGAKCSGERYDCCE
jgi:hypothetical protein